MNPTTLLEQKSFHAQEYIPEAIKLFKENNNIDAVSKVRKVAEAFSKGLIIQLFGENDGNEIILGRKQISTRKPTRFGNLSLEEILAFLELQNFKQKKIIMPKLREIQNKSNPTHHEPNHTNPVITDSDAKLILFQMISLLDFWEIFFNKQIPSDLTLLKHNFEDPHIEIDYMDEWSQFYESADRFSQKNNYIAVFPPDYNGISHKQLEILGLINWSLVFDFNAYSKSSGVYAILKPFLKTRTIRPLTINDLSSLIPIVSEKHIINWVFTNGLDILPETIPQSYKDWNIKFKYPKLIEKMVTEFKNSSNRYSVIIIFYPEKAYIKKIFDDFAELFAPENIKIIVATENSDALDDLRRDYGWYGADFLNLSLNQTIAGILRTVPSKKHQPSSEARLIPARVENDREETIDIGDKYYYYLSRGIEILCQNIENLAEYEDTESDFYRGRQITWRELSLQKDVQRTVQNELELKLEDLLNQAKGARRIDLLHLAGGGGTTLARRVAFNFHLQTPTLVISKFRKNETIESIKDLSEKSQKPLLIVIEAYNVNETELFLFIREINISKKHVLILYVKRILRRDQNNLVRDEIKLLDKMADISERKRFIDKYSKLNEGLQKARLYAMESETLSRTEVIDFPLITFEDLFSEKVIFNYIYSYINGLKFSHAKFLGYTSIIYHYTQKSTNENWVKVIFPEKILSVELLQLKENIIFIDKLLIQDFDHENEETEYWRPRYNLFAEKILEITVGGNSKFQEGRSWRANLHTWIIDLIIDISRSNSSITDEIRAVLKSLFLDRDYIETLGTLDTEDALQGQHSQFSRLISDMEDKDRQKAVFHKLVECFPNEAHFRGHLGRFLYEKAEDFEEFDEALDHIGQALLIAGNDFNMWHIHGMCNKKKIDYLIKSFEFNNFNFDSDIEFETLVQTLTEEAQSSFIRSREINPSNLYSHTAEILTLIRMLDFGKSLKPNETIVDFLSSKENNWYHEKFEQLSELIDFTRDMITLSKELEHKSSLIRSREMLEMCEGKFWSFLQNFNQASEKFKAMISGAERSSRPYFRKLYLMSRLASKSKVHHVKIHDAWVYLNDDELKFIRTNCENSIRDCPTDSKNYLDWLRAIRFSRAAISIDEVISKLRSWYDSAPLGTLAKYQAAYYLFVLHSIKALKQSSLISSTDMQLSNEYRKESMNNLISDSFSFEWYGKGVGIEQMISHSKLGKIIGQNSFFSDPSSLELVKGAITHIFSRQSGIVRLQGGLDAFFVPTHGKFNQNIDETTEVDCYVGFRYGMIHAWEVRRLGEERNHDGEKISSENYYIIKDDVVPTQEPQLHDPKNIPEKGEGFKYTDPLPGLKILGKLNLDEKKPKNRRN